MNEVEVVYAKDKKVETYDIYYAAYLMACGEKLECVKLTHNGKKRILFEFRGPKVLEHAHGYISGQAEVNVRFLKSALNHLKGIVFEKMKQKKI